MTTKVVPGQLVATIDPGDVAHEAADRIATVLRGTIARNGRATVALSGGNTPRAAYALLAQEEEIDWPKVDVFWVDERAVAPDDDRSNYKWAKATLLDPAKVPPRCIHRMPGEARDLDAAAREYEGILRSRAPADPDGVPVLDVVVLGVGDDGHTASLFPGEPTVDVSDRLVVAVPATKKHEARLTLTPPPIEHAKNVFVLAIGESKLPALERVWNVEGDVHQTPARIVRGLRGTVTWIIDRAAGGIAG
jgi:6-phosphogluconolactonase